MLISGTFLKSKISKRIALLLFLAAGIPTLLITGLTHQKISQLTTDYEHKSLVETSRNYALSAFSNLNFAKTTLENIANSTQSHFWATTTPKSLSAFNSLVLVSRNGDTLHQYGNAHLSKKTIEKIIQSTNNNQTRLFIDSGTGNEDAKINLITPHIKNGLLDSILIAEINPNYLWGDKSDYPSSINVCAYQITTLKKIKLFCSSETPASSNAIHKEIINFSTWELFLRAEFKDDSWVFETNRTQPLSMEHLSDFIGSNSYVGITILSLLTVALLSLIEIRKTMVPLESLIDGTRKVTAGNFTQVKVSGKSEFSELADAFNQMSADIKSQLDTLRALSTIDREMVSKLDVDHLVNQVMNRIKQLKPEVIISITRLVEQSDNEMQCIVNLAYDTTSLLTRKAIDVAEINQIKSYEQGHFSNCDTDSKLMHERLMSEFGAKHLWTSPIFWQGEIYAFICIGSEKKLDVNDNDYCCEEIRELVSRIGIGISAQLREEQLQIRAQYDILTGLPNRILLQDRLNHAIEVNERTGELFWVMFIDLDRFKNVNDSLGHIAGDELLLQVSKRLQTEIRESDTVARFGGDEFILILQGGMEENFRLNILHRIINTIATPINISGQELLITSSVGIATYPHDGKTADQLIKHADIAMYRAKELGKNNFQFFTQSMNEKAAKRLQIENLLRSAIPKEELLLYYQPKVDLNTMQTIGMEALIRWNSKELGFVSPVDFIPLAEDTDLIFPIGAWVLKTACKQACEWKKAGYGDLLMSVNVSSRQFIRSDFIETIQTTLAETGLEASQLDLEITESILMHDINLSIQTMRTLRSMGVKISIDDFGTGYSSLSYLKELPIDTLKIDKAFIDDIVSSADKAPIVETIIILAKNLGLTVVAEGVESLEQVNYLVEKRCDQIQGYYFSKPDRAEMIEKKLIKSATKATSSNSALNN